MAMLSQRRIIRVFVFLFVTTSSAKTHIPCQLTVFGVDLILWLLWCCDCQHYQILVRDMYAFYPLLIKYVDLHRSSWLKTPNSEAEHLYLCIADVFNLGSKSHVSILFIASVAALIMTSPQPVFHSRVSSMQKQTETLAFSQISNEFTCGTICNTHAYGIMG